MCRERATGEANEDDRMNKAIVVYGIGDLARTTYEMLRVEGLCDVVAFAVDRNFLKADRFMDLPLVAFEDVESHYPPRDHEMLVLIGYKKMRNRKRMFDRAKAKGYRLPNVIARNSSVPKEITIGENNIVGDYVYIGPFSRMGDNNIVRPHTHIGHDAHIGNHVFISPCCQIAGFSDVGDLSCLGIGATVVEHVTLGEESFVGAGALVLRDTEPFSQYRGNPAEKVGEHKETGIILLR